MSDLNLNFDYGVKNISMTNDNNDNLGFNKDNTLKIEESLVTILTLAPTSGSYWC